MKHKKSTKILFILSVFRAPNKSQKMGGCEISNWLLIKHIAKFYDVRMLTLKGSDEGLKEKYNNIKVYSISNVLNSFEIATTIYSCVKFRLKVRRIVYHEKTWFDGRAIHVIGQL